ncbi:MAG: cell division ATP-binding protein FtsE [Actinomycetaceae bacterium]|nr:cell division ATP-binding protein FtsE [Actinomycetaceae bacterium]
MIDFDNVIKEYTRGTHLALDSISFHIDDGEFVFLVGPSGSGKSTLLSLILAQERPTSGKVSVFGDDISKLSHRKIPFLRRKMGVVFQDFRLLEDKNVFDNVALPLQVVGEKKSRIEEKVNAAIEMVSLDGKARRLPHDLSGGERQRVAIARAMVARPSLLLADEPTGNLDRDTGLSIMRLLHRINQNGTTVVMATHDQDIVNQMRKRVIALNAGVMMSDQKQAKYEGGNL